MNDKALDNQIEYPAVRPTHDNKFILLEKYVYRGVVVPEGYKTNGADVPRVFWSIIPPFKPKYLPAVIVHDYLCDMGEYKLADKYFEMILMSIEDSIETKSMIKAVKLYHKVKYDVMS